MDMKASKVMDKIIDKNAAAVSVVVLYCLYVSHSLVVLSCLYVSCSLVVLHCLHFRVLFSEHSCTDDSSSQCRMAVLVKRTGRDQIFIK